MKIFITGSTGFIGSHLVNSLSLSGNDLLLLNRGVSENSDFKSVKGDLNDINSFSREVKSFHPEAVIHLAWQGLPDYSRSMCEINEKLSCDLFDLALDCGCKVLLSTGSCWEYASRKGKLSESEPLDNTSPFSSAKNSIMEYGSKICQKYDVKFYWPRLFFVYGPSQRANSLVPYIINSAQNALAPEINNPDNSNDFIYITDVARAIEFLLKFRPEDEIFNVGSGFSTSVRQVVKTVGSLMNVEINCPDGINEDSQNENFWADTKRIQSVNNWTPQTSLQQGIKNMIESMR